MVGKKCSIEPGKANIKRCLTDYTNNFKKNNTKHVKTFENMVKTLYRTTKSHSRCVKATKELRWMSQKHKKIKKTTKKYNKTTKNNNDNGNKKKGKKTKTIETK